MIGFLENVSQFLYKKLARATLPAKKKSQRFSREILGRKKEFFSAEMAESWVSSECDCFLGYDYVT